MNLADARGLSFECQPACGFCCTASPLVLPHEAGALGALVTRASDGTLRIPLRGPACSSLRDDDRGCGAYARRPSVCHLYPYQVHAGRRIQATVTLACPGIFETGGAGEPADAGARRAVELALAQPGAHESAARAKETFSELDRRMREWGVLASPDRLRAAFLPHADALAQPGALPSVFAALEAGDLVLEGDAARAVAPLFEAEPEVDLSDLLVQGADEAFDEPQTVIWVEPDFAWTRASSSGGIVKLMRSGRDDRALDARELPMDLTLPATRVVSGYLARLMHRDQTEGAALWLVDASGYQATPAAAYARVLAEASLQVALRAGLLAAEDGAREVGPAHARRGVAAYETAYHSLPTLGSIL